MAGLAVQGVVEPGQENDWHAGDIKDAVVRFGAFARDDVELRSNQSPPGFRQYTVGDPSVVEDVLELVALGPFALEMKRSAGGVENALLGAGDDLRHGLADYLVELAVFVALLGVVIELLAPDILVAGEVVIVDVAFGVEILGFGVVDDVIGAKHHALKDNLRRIGVQGAQLALRVVALGAVRVSAGRYGDSANPAESHLDGGLAIERAQSDHPFAKREGGGVHGWRRLLGHDRSRGFPAGVRRIFGIR